MTLTCSAQLECCIGQDIVRLCYMIRFISDSKTDPCIPRIPGQGIYHATHHDKYEILMPGECVIQYFVTSFLFVLFDDFQCVQILKTHISLEIEISWSYQLKEHAEAPQRADK
jgi:hypothetical protein